MIKLPQMFVFHEKDLGVGKLKCLICQFLELLVLSKDFVCVWVYVSRRILYFVLITVDCLQSLAFVFLPGSFCF